MREKIGVKIMENCSVAFDTNAYRNLVEGLTEDESRKKFEKIKELENSRNINANLIQVVLMELFSHLADKHDPAYNVCKNSIIISYIHCMNSETKKLNYIAEFDTHLCFLLFRKYPDEFIIIQKYFCKLASDVFKNSKEDNLDKLRDNFIICKNGGMN
jgi:hypothetical protein